MLRPARCSALSVAKSGSSSMITGSPAVTVRLWMRASGVRPCAFNAANEEAVAQFLNGKCGFLAMAEVVERVVNRHAALPVTLEALLDVDKWARAEVRRILDIPQA